uniref:Uncharacterized protein n=1 Tax=Arundo donax TaxID=35708 RepID=A0A0A9CEP4_ARUDO
MHVFGIVNVTTLHNSSYAMVDDCGLPLGLNLLSGLPSPLR